MKKIIFLIVLLGLLFQPAPTCTKFDRNRYIVAPVCAPRPIRNPVTLH